MFLVQGRRSLPSEKIYDVVCDYLLRSISWLELFSATALKLLLLRCDPHYRDDLLKTQHEWKRVKDLFQKVQTVGWGFITNTTEYLHYNSTCISMRVVMYLFCLIARDWVTRGSHRELKYWLLACGLMYSPAHLRPITAGARVLYSKDEHEMVWVPKSTGTI